MGRQQLERSKPSDEVLAAGVWWKASAYEAIDGYISPAPGADIAVYDPWTLLSSATYRALFDAIGDYRGRAHIRIRPAETSKRTEAAVVEWCNEYGLPGLLLHKLEQVEFAPRWRRLNPRDPKLLAPTRTIVQWSGLGWNTHETIGWGVDPGGKPIPADYYVDEPEREGKLVGAEDTPDSLLPAHATICEIGSYQTEVQTVAAAWGGYFPSIARTNRSEYPPLASEQFWRAYSEPVEEIVHAVSILANAVYDLTNGASFERERARRTLGSLLLPVSLAPVDTEHGLAPRWLCRSLLAAVAVTALSDLSAKRLRRCLFCEALFEARPTSLRKYCSETHKHSAIKRKQRAKAREVEGQS